MKIGLLNDTHLGITTDGQLKRCFKNLAEKEPDLIIHAGDYCGATWGHKTLRVTCELMREQFPDIPILSVIGNHDRWSGQRPGLTQFKENMEQVEQAFKVNKVHFLDTMGIYPTGNVTIMGCSGWYHERPDTNDWNFLPKWIEGDTHAYLQKQADETLLRLTQSLDVKQVGEIRLFVSHFPVKDCNPWDGNPHTGEILEQFFDVDYFVSGHSHGLKNGPRHFRTATDYGLPDSLVIEL